MTVFTRRSLAPETAAVREAYAPDCLVLDVDADFETLPPEAAEELGLFVDALDLAAYPTDWLPADAPTPLTRYAGTDFTIGMPGDGTVVWTRQTDPPTVLVKQRAEGTPAAFRSFLLAEAFVQIAVGVPEQFLPFFGESYAELAEATPVSPSETYQLAAALFDAWVGLHTRPIFASWCATAGETNDDRDPLVDETFEGETIDSLAAELRRDSATALARVTGRDPASSVSVDADAAPVDADASPVDADAAPVDADADFGPHPELFDAWVDAGDRLAGRLEDLSTEVARGQTSFPAATEYACSAVKHGLALPAPFGALDTAAYREHGPEFAVEWARKTYARLDEN
ncbi:MAG: hypothetical protein ABEH80_05070, partial [Halobaculum sp.]